MSTKAKAHSTASTEEHSDHDLDFVQMGDEPIANVRNNDHDDPDNHQYLTKHPQQTVAEA